MSGKSSNRVMRASERCPAAGRPPRLPDWNGGLQVFVPQGYEPRYDYPLLVWLPDPAGRRFDLGRIMARVSLRNFVAVAAPTTSRGMASETAVWRAVERVADRLSVHPGRVWLVGHAAGGSHAFRIACRHPDSFAGVVSLGGGFPLDEPLFARLGLVRRMPMLLCCRQGAAAASAAHVDRMLRLFHAAGAMLAMRIYPGTDDLSRTTLADVNRWLMDEVCGMPARITTPVAG